VATIYKMHDSQTVTFQHLNTTRYDAHLKKIYSLKYEQSISDNKKKKKNIFSIILFGESGVGKSTFINALSNYLKYENFEKALLAAQEANSSFLIPSQFTMKNNTNKEETITLDNQNFDVGQSATQYPKMYLFTFKDGIILRIIDTPGIRGNECDAENMRKLLRCLEIFQNLDAICIFLKPNQATDNDFDKILNGILAHFHREALDNIILCVTHEQSRPGTPILFKDYLQRKKINMSGEPFCFDSESFRQVIN
jgi:GTPase SAR1 family protein